MPVGWSFLLLSWVQGHRQYKFMRILCQKNLDVRKIMEAYAYSVCNINRSQFQHILNNTWGKSSLEMKAHIICEEPLIQYHPVVLQTQLVKTLLKCVIHFSISGSGEQYAFLNFFYAKSLQWISSKASTTPRELVLCSLIGQFTVANESSECKVFFFNGECYHLRHFLGHSLAFYVSTTNCVI